MRKSIILMALLVCMSVFAFAQTVDPSLRGLDNAIKRVSKDIIKNVPDNARIVIIPTDSQDKTIRDYINGELELLVVEQGFRVTERAQLRKIIAEQNFQLGWEVDENTAVSIGKITGATFMLVSCVDGEGNLRRLRAKIMDVTTGEIVGVATGRF